MKNYYFLEENKEKGPYTLKELENLNLENSTYVWKKGMDNWIKMNELPEFQNQLSESLTPIPYTKELRKITKEKIILTSLILWISFNLFALITSYSEIEVFNKYGDRNTEKFWPFINFYENTERKYFDIEVSTSWNEPIATSWDEPTYGGIFIEYDWTEFSLYVGISLVIYLIFRIYSKE